MSGFVLKMCKVNKNSVVKIVLVLKGGSFTGERE
jgi:hypothetical protein